MRKQIQNNFKKKGIKFFYSKNPKKQILKSSKKGVRCIRKYNRITVSLIALILLVFVFGGVNIAYESLQITNHTEENIYEETQKIQESPSDLDEEIENKLKEYEKISSEEWQIEIPIIGLIAPIAHGTTQEVMREYVGHFEQTSLWKGNIGLAAHNRRISNKLF